MRNRTLALYITAMFALAAAAAQAADHDDIVLANKVVARIRTGGKYGSVWQRSAKINQALVHVLSYEDLPPQMTLAQVDGRWTVGVGSTTLIQVYPEDAAGAGLTEKALAMQWKASMAQQIPLAVSPLREAGGAGPSPDPAPLPDEPVAAGVPPEDLPLVAQIAPILDRARRMDEAQYELHQKQMEANILAMIWRYRRAAAAGPPPAGSDLSIANVLMRARVVSDERFRIERDMYAGKTIQRVRHKYNITPGTGPVTPPEPVAPPPLPAPQLQPGTPIAVALLGTGLDPNNKLMNAGQHFPANVPQVMLYLEIKGAPNNTIIGISIHKGDQTIARKRLQLSGDRPFAVAFYPQKTEGFSSGDYECRLSVNDQPVGVIPFRVAAAQ